jgi:hypothetical protein
MSDNDDELGFVETRAETKEERKFRVAASIKIWVVVAVTAVSMGFSFGLWSAQGQGTKSDVEEIKVIISRMPPPDKIANKEVFDVKMEEVQRSLSRIEVSVARVSDELVKHQEFTIKQMQLSARK